MNMQDTRLAKRNVRSTPDRNAPDYRRPSDRAQGADSRREVDNGGRPAPERETTPGSRVARLGIWQDAISAVKEVYSLSKNWPKEEFFGITTQARRAAVQISAKIAEGVGRKNPAETSRSVQVALGSVYELDSLLLLASELGYCPTNAVSPMRESLDGLARRIQGFIRYQESDRCKNPEEKERPRGSWQPAVH